MDFDNPSGERVIVNPRLFQGDQTTLTVITNIPDNSSQCAIGGTSWVYFLETQPAKDHAALEGTVAFVANALAVGAAGILLPSGKQVTIVNLSDGTSVSIGKPISSSTLKLKRAMWRELIKQ